jgi:hypothetical protein
MSFRGRIFPGSLSYPQDAGAFLSHAQSLGATFTTSQKRALAYLVNNLADLGIGAPGSNFVIYPFIGGSNAATNALNLFFPKTTANNLTFVGSPTHSSSGVTFNGTSQYAYGQSLALYPMTPNLTLANVSIGACVSGMGTGVYVPMGIFSGAGVQTKTYSTAGSFSFDFNLEAPQFTSFTVSAWGGGGAGGGSNVLSNRPGGGGAGGGYGTRAVTLTGAQLDTAMTITVGAGGTTNNAAAGGAGGDSTIFHPNFTGVTGKGGPGGNTNTATLPGAAVAGAGGSTSRTGGAGAAGGASVTYGGGGGGSSAGTSANGNAGSTPTTTAGGAAGTAPAGGVAGGAGGAGSAASGSNGNPGVAGGGGGGGAGSSNAGRSGGSGGAGKVTVAWTSTAFKRTTMSIFTTDGSQLMDICADTDATSRYYYVTTPSLLNGVRVGSRTANTTNTSDMGYYIQNNAASALTGPTVMSTTSFSQTPIFFFGAANSWGNGTGVGNNPTNFLGGTLNFSFIGPGLSNTKLQALYTLITTYNGILGR